MAYLGNAPARSFISFERQVFTIVNSQTAYTLDHSVNNENDLRLVINNIVQEPGSGKAYTASGTTLTLSAALTNGTDEMYCVFLGRATATNAPAAGSVGTSQLASDAVTEAKIADDAVESEHLNNNVISGQTELAAEPADTDEFLVSDAGTLKRIDYSYIKGGGITEADAFRIAADQNGDSSPITGNIERVDDATFAKIGTGMSESSGIFTFPSTGLYYIGFTFSIQCDANADGSMICQIMGTANDSSYDALSEGALSGDTSNNQNQMCSIFAYFNCTNTSTHKVRFDVTSMNSNNMKGATNETKTGFTFIRLGDSV